MSTEVPVPEGEIRHSPHAIYFSHPELIPEMVAKRLSEARNLTYTFAETTTQQLATEYASLFRAVKRAAGADLVVLYHAGQNPGMYRRGLQVGLFTQVEREIRTANTTEFVNPWWGRAEVTGRDHFSHIPPYTFTIPNYRLAIQGGTLSSGLGEGGTVLHTPTRILVAESSSKYGNTQQHIQLLTERGYKVGVVPNIIPKRQLPKHRQFPHTHIDAHSSLIENPTGEAFLYVTRSYYRQNDQTKRTFHRQADMIEATLRVVDDKELSSQSLNSVQLPNGMVVTSRGKADREYNAYTEKLVDDIGSDQVVITDRNIDLLTTLMQAGPRCMTNALPMTLHRQIIGSR